VSPFSRRPFNANAPGRHCTWNHRRNKRAILPATKKNAAAHIRIRPEGEKPDSFLRSNAVSGQAQIPDSSANQPLVMGSGPFSIRSRRPPPPAKADQSHAAITPSVPTHSCLLEYFEFVLEPAGMSANKRGNEPAYNRNQATSQNSVLWIKSECFRAPECMPYSNRIQRMALKFLTYHRLNSKDHPPAMGRLSVSTIPYLIGSCCKRL